MEQIVSYGFAAVILFALVQWIKKKAAAKNINPLLILAGLSLLGGVVYGVLSNYGLWNSIVSFLGVVAPVANLIYSVLATMTRDERGQTPLAQNSSSL